MRSLRTKITAVTISAIILTMVIATSFGVIAIWNIGMNDSEQILRLMCQTGEKNLDDYFENLQEDIQMVSSYVETDLDGISDDQLQQHLDRVSGFFKKIMVRTNGILTYYYRIDPAVSSEVKGFWYVNLNGEGFQEHEVTDITKYDTEDTSQLIWFTVPKATGQPVWLPPYITDTIDVRVISYNIPVYYNGQFIGVIGIELDYSAMAEQVNNITLYETGYAFITDANGAILYHPHMTEAELENSSKIPDGLVSADSVVRYSYEGTEKLAYWLPLANGDHLNVAVPLDEINAGWHKWAVAIILTFAALLAVFIVFIMRYAEKITKPLRRLTEAAEQIDEGNYDCDLDYRGKDEIGVLTQTFRRVTSNLKKYITDLNDLAYADALTSLHNKGAFDIMVRDIQTRLDEPGNTLKFAVCIFDCNMLKQINDQNGHDKGDIYLKETAQIICEVFDHSPVFRIGGDEFAALLLENDYENREELLKVFDERCAEKRGKESDAWEKVDVARGVAVYDPQEDQSVNDVVRRADKNMYENKWLTKHGRE